VTIKAACLVRRASLTFSSYFPKVWLAKVAWGEFGFPENSTGTLRETWPVDSLRTFQSKVAVFTATFGSSGWLGLATPRLIWALSIKLFSIA
jgi:hypothetical protein